MRQLTRGAAHHDRDYCAYRRCLSVLTLVLHCLRRQAIVDAPASRGTAPAAAERRVEGGQQEHGHPGLCAMQLRLAGPRAALLLGARDVRTAGQPGAAAGGDLLAGLQSRGTCLCVSQCLLHLDYRHVLPGSSAWTGAPVLTRTTRVGHVTVTADPSFSLQCNVQVPEPVLQQLEALISSLIGQSSTFGTAVLTSEHLLKILDVFRGLRKVVLCKVCLVDVVQDYCCDASRFIEQSFMH
jgi:hypothetical protein